METSIFCPFHTIDGRLNISREGRLIWERGNGDIVPLTKDSVRGLYSFFPNPTDAKIFIEDFFNDEGYLKTYQSRKE